MALVTILRELAVSTLLVEKRSGQPAGLRPSTPLGLAPVRDGIVAAVERERDPGGEVVAAPKDHLHVSRRAGFGSATRISIL